ncbi:MAG: aldose 1-epimerase [Fimbriiglobus sp.]
MGFEITTHPGQAGDKSGDIYRLTGPNGVSAEVWPFLGFNCLRWSVAEGPLLYTAPDWETNPIPTRSGHPVLFPFPNRFKHGRFRFEGQEYQLPLNDSTKTHAIHGFSPRNPWRVVETRIEADFAEITGEFRLSQDVPDLVHYWPGDLILRLSYQLSEHELRVVAVVTNPEDRPVPFGLGYHPYFQLPDFAGQPADGYMLHAPAQYIWHAVDSLATGEQLPIPSEVDFGTSKPIGSVALDHLYGGLGEAPFAVLAHPESRFRLTMQTDKVFRELLLFTPPHRQAVAIEPYTCSTDAANFSERGLDAGWRILAPGEKFEASVRYLHSRLAASSANHLPHR